MDKNIVFINGTFVPEVEAKIPVTTHALHYGTGCFEGIRAYYNDNQKALFIFRMEDHFNRLKESCKILFMEIPHTVKELCDITAELVKKNFAETDLYIRPLAYKADPAVGNFNLKSLKDGFFIYTTPLGRHLRQDGVRAMITSWERVTDNMIPPRGKITGSYANAALAKTDSALSGYDEAIFTDRNGHILEGSTENIFIIKNNVLITPPISSDILIGITRDMILKICKDKLNYQTIERDIDKTELYNADEIFFTGTGAEVSPVTEVDGRKIGNVEIGEISKQIREYYNKLVHGESNDYSEYLTKVTI